MQRFWPASGAKMTDSPRHSVSVAGVVVNDEGQVLVIRRRDNGEWQPPGGVLELNETIEDGLRREVREETGIEIAPGPLTGVYKNMSLGVIALVFRCTPRGGHPQPGDETEQVLWMSLDQVEGAMSPAFAVRILDAFNEKTHANLRSHDGSGNL